MILKTNDVSLKVNQYAEETANYSDMGVNDLEYTTKAIIMKTNTSIIEDELHSEAVLLKEQTTLCKYFWKEVYCPYENRGCICKHVDEPSATEIKEIYYQNTMRYERRKIWWEMAM